MAGFTTGIFEKTFELVLKAYVLILLIGQNPCLAQSVDQLEQVATVYDGRGFNRQFLGRPGELHDFNDAAVTVCSTGAWIFYKHYGYQGEVEYIFKTHAMCTSFEKLGGELSSLRFAGSPANYTENTLTIYSGEYFTGTDGWTSVDLPNLINPNGREVLSLIITGAEPWTLCEFPNYQGDCTCVYPPISDNVTPGFIYSKTAIGMAADKSIQSVKKGCFGTRTVMIHAVQPNMRVGFLLHGIEQ